MNVAIFLKRFKKSNQSIIEDILHGNSDAFGPEPLRELLKLLPESDEVEKLQAFGGDPSQLAVADSFMYQLTALPRFKVRIESMLLKEEFDLLCSSLKKDISTLHSAARELLSCVELHSILHLVLEAGNIMNAGGYGANAVGFKLSSLLSLADTKANKPGMNLLHFVALEAQKKDDQLLMFPERLLHIERATRVSVESLDEELENLSRRISHIQENIQSDVDLLQQLNTFLQSAAVTVAEVNNSRAELQREGDNMIDFFCEDKETFKLDECFNIFQHFCSKFRKAVQDNVEREMRAESRLKRLKDLEVKRGSWAGLDKLGGVFGSRCRSETDVQAALKREGLLGLLRPHPISPQSPLGQLGSLRRSRQQLSDGNTDHTESDTQTVARSPEMTIQVETHTLVPALQAFNFDPLPDRHHGNTPTLEYDLQEPNQANLNVTENEVNPEIESRGGCEEPQNPVEKPTATTDGSEMNVSPKQSEKPDEEEHTLACSNSPPASPTEFLTDQSALNSMRDSIESTNHTSEPKPTHQLSLESSNEAPGSYITTSTEGEEKPLRQSASPEDRRLPSKTSGRAPKTMSTPKPAVVLPKSSSSKPSSSTKTRPLHPVRTLNPSETQSMRKVIPLSRNPQVSRASAVHIPSNTPPAQRTSLRRSSEHRSSMQRSSLKSSEQRSFVTSSEQSSSVKSSEQRSSVKSSEQRPSVKSSEQRSSMQKSSMKKASMQRSSVKKAMVQQKSPPEEKMCRSTLRALAQAGGNVAPPTQQNSTHSHAPHFAQGTVASATRSAAVTPGNLPVKHGTLATTSKGPSLNRATSLRLAQSGVTSPSKVILPSMPTRAKSVRLTPSAGHVKKNTASPFDKSAFSRDSQDKPHRPAWR
ncbi:FH2 domain-containing protein 1-like isoform X2 [Colossoma macropomum]|nr:FH2 domain-containing protein 1-like isoform X2 [Colossoma macropomum]